LTKIINERAVVMPKENGKKGKDSGKGNKSRVGGTALPGAKSTQPKQPSASSNPNQQQLESYNREMRRRMQHLGAGPYSQDQRMRSLQEQRNKRIERRKRRMEERRAEAKKAGPIGKITIGRKNLYFVLVVAAIILLLIAFAVLRQFHVLG
jgi:hypothetical protein